MSYVLCIRICFILWQYTVAQDLLIIAMVLLHC